jgi:DNA primase
MLPVIDRQKRVVGFGGRLLDAQAKDRKYVNSPDSPLYHKKEQLYGLHAALEPIRKSGTVIVVEGNFDVLALHEAGIDEVVAPMGTALTGEQLKILDALGKRIVLVFDGDGAGIKAAKKAIPELAELSQADLITGVRIARIERGRDPDDLVRTQGADAFRRLVETARPFLNHLINEAAEDPTIPGRLAALEQIADILVKLPNPTARELYASEAAGVLGLQLHQVTRALREAAAKVKRPATPTAEAPAPAKVVPPAKLPPEELQVVVLLARYPELHRRPEATRVGELLVHPVLRQLYRTAAAEVAEAGRLQVETWLDGAPAAERSTVAAALMDTNLSEVGDPPSLLGKLATRLELLRVEAEIAMNTRLQREAHARGDEEAARALAVRGIELRKTKEGLLAALQRP